LFNFQHTELLRLKIEIPRCRLALGDWAAFANPVRTAGGGQLRELDATTGRQRHFARPSRGEDFHAALQVDEFAKQRQWHQRSARDVAERAECLRTEPGSPTDPVSFIGVELARVNRHLLVKLVAESLPLRLECRKVCRRQRHEERLLPVVGREAVARVQIAKLLMGVNLFLGLIGADIPERERGCLQHGIACRVLTHRPGRGPRNSAFDASGTFDGRRGLVFDERHQFIA